MNFSLSHTSRPYTWSAPASPTLNANVSEPRPPNIWSSPAPTGQHIGPIRHASLHETLQGCVGVGDKLRALRESQHHRRGMRLDAHRLLHLRGHTKHAPSHISTKPVFSRSAFPDSPSIIALVKAPLPHSAFS